MCNIGTSLRLALIGLVVTADAWAHLPITIGGENVNEETAFAVEDVDLSQVAYHRRDASQPELWLRFESTGNSPLFL